MQAMKIELKLKPFQVPNYVFSEHPPVLRQEGFQESPKFELRELSEEALSQLCDDFRRKVFEKAGKKDLKK
jgi:hypothetical protein